MKKKLIFVGTSGWTYDDWSGRFYPEKVKGSERLSYYASQFDTVEVNATFYRLPSQAMISAWNKRLQEGFHLVVKGSRLITRMKKLGDCEEQVHFLGFVSRADLISLYRNAFALTYVSFCGPENLPPLEVFALGCPVVASKVSGAAEQLGEAAILVDPSNPEEIANAIKVLLDDPSLVRTMVERGRQRALRWTGRDFVHGVFKILDDLDQCGECDCGLILLVGERERGRPLTAQQQFGRVTRSRLRG